MQEPHFFHWSFAIGDPSLMGWLTVAAYFFAAGLSCLVFKNARDLFPQPTIQKQKAFWLVMAFTMFALGINKQLDLQSFLTDIGRYYAIQNGWYEHRKIIQSIFITAIVVTSACFMMFLIWYFRDTLKYNGLAICGLCLLASFIAIRASSFHHVDIFINTTILSLRINWIIELSGIFMVVLAAGLNMKATLYDVPRDH
jgi:hypothetical protein